MTVDDVISKHIDNEFLDNLIDDPPRPLDDLKQDNEHVEYVKKTGVDPEWDWETIRKAVTRKDISNEFVRSVAENLDLFTNHEKNYLQKNCTWDILHPPQILDKIKEQEKKRDDFNDWVKKKRRNLDQPDWIEKIRREVDSNPRYFMEEF